MLFREETIPKRGEHADSVPERHVRVKVTMNLDGDLVAHFKALAERSGMAYQFLINQALREYIEGNRTEKVAREVGLLLLDDPSFMEQMKERLK